jgi:DNA-binding GntR family transcriptional regulator
MNHELPNITRLSIADQVHDYLREAILSGRIAMGTRLVESQVARDLKTSRAPVREAVRRLTEENLLEIRTHFGPSVVTLTLDKIRQLYEVRLAIESLAIRELCRSDGHDLVPLEALVGEMRAASAAGAVAALVDAELRFHQTLCRLAGNPYVGRIAELIDGQVRLALTLDNASYANLADVAEEHVPLLDAIRRGCPDAATHALSHHILASLENLEQAGTLPATDGAAEDGAAEDGDER